MVTLAYYLVLEDALIIQRALTLGGTITVLLLYSLTILDLTKEENMLIFSGAVKCNLSKLETGDQQCSDPSFCGKCSLRTTYI